MLHEKHRDWIEARGISADLAEKLGLATVQKDGCAWLAVPYVERGVTVNHKYRLISEKRHQMDEGAPLVLWNHDCLLEQSDKPVVICEGEWDAMVALSLGWRALSVPNGAPAQETEDVANARRYDFLWRSKDLLNEVKSFILATDGDAAGIALRADLIRLLGADRCSFVEYPLGVKEPLKDLNEVLETWGPEEVARVLNDAKPVPVQGLYKPSDFPEVPPLRGLPCGIDPLDEFFEVVFGTLIVLTGYANMGKTTVLDTILARMLALDIPICVASFETMPRPILFDAIARALIGCGQSEFANHPQRRAAYETLEKRMTVITNALDDELEFDIDTFLETARIAVQRDGARVVVIDPWNELEHKRQRDESLTEYIGRAIRKVKAFAKRHHIVVIIVAHPTKPLKGVNQIPSLYDISDSAMWSNKADYGLVYHRKDKTLNEAQLAVVKVRKGLPGKAGVALVKFDHRTGRIAAA